VCALKAQAARLEQELAQRDMQLAACQAMLTEAARDKADLMLRAQALQEDLSAVMANHARDAAAAAEAAARALRSSPAPGAERARSLAHPLALASPSRMPVSE
jgi:septal ring factor EnvC (AmiA/AmiB activator)